MLSGVHKTLHTFFPVPQFLRMSAVGFDIADRRLRFLELGTRNGQYEVERFGEMPVPPGVIVGGQLKRPDEIKALLKKMRREKKINFVHVSLPEERAYLVKMEVPDENASEEDIRTAILAQLEEYVPVPPKEAVFDYKLVEDSARRGGYQEAVVSVMTRKDVSQYIDMFEGTGITPVSFEIEAQAIARSVIPSGVKETIMIIDFGRTRTGIFIVSDGLVRFTSTTEMGSEMITRAVEKYFSVEEEEAERIKNTYSISRSAQDAEFMQAAMSTLAVLRDEINKVIIYWQTHRTRTEEVSPDKEMSEIKNIVITGGGSNLRGLPDYFATSLHISTTLANPWANVFAFEDYIPPIPLSQALGYSSAIGLALGHEEENKK